MVKKSLHGMIRPDRPRRAAIIRHAAQHLPWRRLGMGAAVALLAGEIMLLAFHQGSLHRQQMVLEATEQALARHTQLLGELQRESMAHTDAMSSQIARLQAQVLSLNALGEVMSDLMQLEEGSEFRFDAEAGVGGRSEPRHSQMSLEPAELLASVQALHLQVEDQRLQLEILSAMNQERRVDGALYPSGWPVRGGWISSYYGMRKDPFHGRRAFHSGVDFGAKHGSRIYAAATGIVEFAGSKDQYGLMVVLNHGGGYQTRYSHASELLVEVGQAVERGASVARVGSTGRSTGPHLHFEVLKDGKAVNPLNFLSVRR